MTSLHAYNTFPPTHGKCVLHTTLGPIDVELWPKEAPNATRHFALLAAQRRYEKQPFHRVVRGEIAQLAAADSPSPLADAGFADEFHSRLRFSQRGLLAMASSGPDGDRSQFFITLDRCPWLDGKHTIFGRVTGNTVYNLARFNELELDGEQPVYPPRIERVEMLLEPFDDLVVPQLVAEARLASEPAPKRRRSEKKNVNLLSFGTEVAEEERALEAASMKVSSAHDLLAADAVLSRARALDPPGVAAANDLERVRGAAVSGSASTSHGKAAGDFSDRMLERASERNARHAGVAEAEKRRHVEEAACDAEIDCGEGARAGGWRWRGVGAVESDDNDPGSGSEDEATARMGVLEERRAQFFRRKRERIALSKEHRQQATLQRLIDFQKRLAEDREG